VRSLELHVDRERCIRCGACAALLPDVFDVTGNTSRVARQPEPRERLFSEAARAICPTDAIRLANDDERLERDPASAPSFHELAIGAERVRWTLGDVPFGDVDPKSAPPELRAVVREMAFSEHATYSATQRFLDAFFDDVDFTQWIAVWFYEETRHPHVLAEWLRAVGESLPTDFVSKGRISTPFMRSPLGTLVTNVVSEVTAAQAYRRLARTSPEPVLATIARHISGDEARHAASFFRFARAMLANATPEAALRDRARGLEVLQAWLGGSVATTHPVAQMIERVGDSEFDMAGIRTRVVRVVGLLLDLPLRREGDVPPALRALLSERRT
jgi:ferredoxin